MMIKNQFLAILCLLILFSCEDYERSSEVEFEDPTQVYYQSSFVGKLKDADGQTLQANPYRIGLHESVSIKRGLFFADQIKANKRGQWIELPEQRNVISAYPVLNQSSYIDYHDNRKLDTWTVDSDQEWKETIQNKELRKNASTIFEKDGQVYNGLVHVSYASLNLDQLMSWSSFPAQMGAHIEGNELGCIKYEDIFSVHLNAEDDSDLKVTDQNPLVLDFSQDGQFLDFSQDHMLWYFDLTTGLWLPYPEENFKSTSIEIFGSNIFAWGNFHESTEIKAKLSLEGNPLVDAQIILRDDLGNIVQTSRSASDGVFRIYGPANSTLSLEITGNCTSLYSEEISLAGGILNLGEIILSSDHIIIQGNILNCENKQDIGASLFWEHDGQSGFIHLPNEDFTVVLPTCSDQNINTTAIDLSTGEEGGEIWWNQSVHGDTIKLDPLYYCSLSQEQYITIRMDGDVITFWNGTTSLVNDRVVLSNNESMDSLVLYLSEFDQGDITSDSVSIVFSLPDLGDGGYQMNCPASDFGCGMEQFKVTHVPDASGDWIRGYFKGEFWVKRLNRNSATYRRGEGSFQLYKNF